ncbi:nuclease-related domain-containing protein [Caballeronia sp. NCTM1]|uniref:nuclease-related domain-containing protein n=1 Tax=Caballeronia sp. NCTM1 TaxID=2921753 RepID=UPI002027ADD9|nr:nuclease-related domain-containing protein [Caballeronia sp. NCTM1]
MRDPIHKRESAFRSLSDRIQSGADHLAHLQKHDSVSGSRRRRVCRWLRRRIAPIFGRVCESQVHFREDVILEHAPGTANATTLVHCLAVTPFGVFVVNYYDWRGEVRPGTNDDELLVIDDLGGVTVHTSPLRRAKPALRYLRSVLSQHDCPVESIAIFAEAECRLHPTAPDGVLALSDLHYFLRLRLLNFRATHARYLDAARLDSHISRTCGIQAKPVTLSITGRCSPFV